MLNISETHETIQINFEIHNQSFSSKFKFKSILSNPCRQPEDFSSNSVVFFWSKDFAKFILQKYEIPWFLQNKFLASWKNANEWRFVKKDLQFLQECIKQWHKYLLWLLYLRNEKVYNCSLYDNIYLIINSVELWHELCFFSPQNKRDRIE